MPEQLTNEELVTLIKQGDRSKIPALWEQISRFVSWKAVKAAEALKDRAWVDYEDLYNAGFLALAAAIDTYKEDCGAFTTWLTFYLKDAFAEAAGYRTRTQQENSKLCTVSLDKPLGDDEDGTIGDLIADPTDYMAGAEERIYTEQLHNALEDALDAIDEQESRALRLRHYEQKTLNETGDALGVTSGQARTLEYNGLKHIRRSGAKKRLESFIDLRTNFYLGTSVKSQQSPVELLVVRREEMRPMLNN